MTKAASSEAPPLDAYLSLLIVYIVWGSTYLAIRIGVREGSGFPPFTLSASRVLAAGILMFAWALLSRRRIRLSRRELAALAVSGVLLWGGGNGLVTWAEQRADSGYAALIIGATPIWGALLEALLDRRLPSWRLALSLLIGFAGIALLSLPVLQAGGTADLAGLAALLLAAVSWAAGTVLFGRARLDLSVRVSAAYQQLFGSVALAMGVVFLGEPAPDPVPEAVAAWFYLLLFGSLIGYTAYIRVLRLLPTNLVMTYAYVNPVIAVLLGWAILREPITGWMLAGAALVLVGVAGVFRQRRSVAVQSGAVRG